MDLNTFDVFQSTAIIGTQTVCSSAIGNESMPIPEPLTQSWGSFIVSLLSSTIRCSGFTLYIFYLRPGMANSPKNFCFLLKKKKVLEKPLQNIHTKHIIVEKESRK